MNIFGLNDLTVTAGYCTTSEMSFRSSPQLRILIQILDIDFSCGRNESLVSDWLGRLSDWLVE